MKKFSIFLKILIVAFIFQYITFWILLSPSKITAEESAVSSEIPEGCLLPETRESDPSFNVLNQSITPEIPTGTYINTSKPLDSSRPALCTLLGNINCPPEISNTYDLNGGKALGIKVTAGQPVYVPVSGRTIGGGKEVLVSNLSAANKTISLQYTLESGFTNGCGEQVNRYDLHLKNVDISPQLSALYSSTNGGLTGELPALAPGYKIGTASTNELVVAIADTGSLMNLLEANDFWIQGQITPNTDAALMKYLQCTKCYSETCELPPIAFAASPSCATCGTTTAVQDTGNGWTRFLDFIGTLTNPEVWGGIKMTFEIKNSSPVVAPKDISTTMVGSKTESTFNNFIGNAESFDVQKELENSALNNPNKISFIPQALSIMPPDTAKEHINLIKKDSVNNEITYRKVFYQLEGGGGGEDKNPSDGLTPKNNSSGQKDLPIKSGVPLAHEIGGMVANVLWIPNKEEYGLLVQDAPPGMDQIAYQGEKNYSLRNTYLAEQKNKYLAQNLSEEDKISMAFNVQKNSPDNSLAFEKPKITNAINSNTQNKYSYTPIALPDFNSSLCILPNNQPYKPECIPPQEGSNRIIIESTAYDHRCTGKNEKGEIIDVSCETQEKELAFAEYYDKYTCKDDVDTPDGFCKSKNSPSEIVKSITAKQQTTAQNQPYTLIAEEGSENKVNKNIGLIESMATYWLAILQPEQKIEKDDATVFSSAVSFNANEIPWNIGTINENLSGEKPLEVQKVSSQGFANFGEGPVVKSDTVIPTNKTATCSTHYTYSIGLIPEDQLQNEPKEKERNKTFNQLTDICKSKDEPPIKNYCGTVEIFINNTSSYLTIENADSDDRSKILDSSSDLMIKLALRYVSPSVLIMSNGQDYVGVPPGSDIYLNSQFSAEEFELWYVPIDTSINNLKNYNYWVANAAKFKIDGSKIPSGPVNATIELRVAPGSFRIIKKGNSAYTMGWEKIVNPSEEAKKAGAIDMVSTLANNDYFTLGSSNNSNTENKSFCGKINFAIQMRGTDKESQKKTSVGECKLSKNYDIAWNNACGGNGGTAEDPNFWKKDYKEKGDPSLGKNLYEQIFGKEFTVSGNDYSCEDIFPTTFYQTDCSSANNLDINTNSALSDLGNLDNYYNYNGDYYSKSALPILGKGMYYSSGYGNQMEEIFINRGMGSLKEKCPDCDGAGAMLRAGDIGRTVCVKVTDKNSFAVGKVFKVFIVDVAARHDIPDLIKPERRWAIDLDYNLGSIIGMVGYGPREVEIIEPVFGKCIP